MKTPTSPTSPRGTGLILRKIKVPGKPKPGIPSKSRFPKPAPQQPSRFSWSSGPDAVKTN